MGRILSMILKSDPLMLDCTKNERKRKDLQLVTIVPSRRDLSEGISIKRKKSLEPMTVVVSVLNPLSI